MKSTLNKKIESGQAPRILVVDDEIDSAKMISYLLKSEGYTTAIAYSAADMFEKLTEEDYDLILLDVMLGELNGLKICKTIKSDPVLKYVPVILVTALGNMDDKLRGFDEGADGYIVKPFNNDELLAHVRVMLRIKELQSQLQEKNFHYLEMLSFICHELKTQLVAIGGFAQRLFSDSYGKLTEPQRQAVDVIRESTRIMEEMLANFFNLSRIENGELAIYRKEAFVSEDIISPVIKEIRELPYMKESRITLTQDPLSEELAIHVDPDLLKIVFRNLFVNALTYSISPSKVFYGWKEEDSFVRFYIENESFYDISEDEIGFLFEKFKRLEGSARKGTRGSGLGLYIATMIIKVHGGEIWAELAGERQIVFNFTVPKG